MMICNSYSGRKYGSLRTLIFASICIGMVVGILALLTSGITEGISWVKLMCILMRMSPLLSHNGL